MYNYFCQGRKFIKYFHSYPEPQPPKNIMQFSWKWILRLKEIRFCPSYTLTNNETTRKSFNNPVPLFFYMDIIMPKLLATPGN